MYPYWKHLALSWITSRVRSNSPQVFWKHRLQLFSKHFLKTWAFPASLTICYRHLGMGAAYYNVLCDSHDTLWASSYLTASSSTKSSSALIRVNQNFLKALPTAASANSLDSLTSVPRVLKYLQKSLLWPGGQRWGDTHMLFSRLPLGIGGQASQGCSSRSETPEGQDVHVSHPEWTVLPPPTTCKQTQTKPDGDSVHSVLLKGCCFH